jgi:hypothetical protein
MNSEPNSLNTSEQFVLYVWPGEWDLDSLDAESLTALVIVFLHFVIIFS